MKQTWFAVLACSCSFLACHSHPPAAPDAHAAPVSPSAPAAQAGPVAKPAQLADAATVRAAHASALQWLAARQGPDGSWSGEKNPNVNHVGITGLALLALQSGGSTPSSGPHAQQVARGVQWLMTRQDPDSGLIGERAGHSFHYEHAIATQALCLALKGAPSEQLQSVAQQAAHYVARARNPYGAWRYNYPPTGENDTSVTGWMIEALVAARGAGLAVDDQAFVGALAWVDEVTDPKTARVGYDAVGSLSSRIVGVNDQYPTDRHEAMTASGMLIRMNAGQTTADGPQLSRHAGLLRTHPPEWDPSGLQVDEYYWYFGSKALRRLGGAEWETWRVAMQKALLDGQATAGEERGAWSGIGAWTHTVGSVLSTSLNALSLATTL